MDGFLIAGLGNPGRQYENTRHNAGFRLVNALSTRWGIPLDRRKWDALWGQGRVAGQRLILLQPQTYMNESGRAIRQAVHFYQLPLSRLLVVHDDIDIQPGTIRIRPSGSAGTHNGMRSIVRELGSQDFPRLKLAVGHKPEGYDLADFVLSRFSADEQAVFEEEIQAAQSAVEDILSLSVEEAMNHWNGWRSPKAAAAEEENKK